MDELVCITVVADPGESANGFNKRLIAFWSHMLRQHEADYEGVYAEATHFSSHEDRVARQYFVALASLDVVLGQLTANQFAIGPVDRDDLYTRYEATPPDWFQLEH